MAKQFVTDAGTLYIPGAYSKYTVQNSVSGLATTGVLMLVGEADAGPRFSAEADLEENAFGPDQLADVVAKYKSGPLVDAFRAATAPANDPDIVGAFSAAILVKTNLSTKASATLPTAYATLYDKSYGKLGNQISYQTLQAQAEVVPTTGTFTYIPPVALTPYGIRVSGATVVGTSISAAALPDAFAALIDGLSGVAATGGTNRNMLTSAGGRTASIAATGNSIVVTVSSAWDTTPTVGDTLTLPASAPSGLRDPAGGVTDENVGAYIVTAATATTVTATKLSDFDRVGAVAGTITPPANVAVAVSLVAATDLQAFAPVTISVDGATVLDGRGKSLEIAEITGGADLLSRYCWTLVAGVPTEVTWISKASAPKLLISAAEYRSTLNVARSSDFISESFTVGGEVALKLGYKGTSATVTITDTELSTTVVGGAGVSFTGATALKFADFPTIKDIADYLNAQTDYTASVGTAVLGQLPSTALDNMAVAGICCQFTNTPGRIKIDGYRLGQAVNNGSVLVQLGNPAANPASGLPTAMAAQQFLSGGAKGGTSDSDVTAAFAALEQVDGNFLVPLFSRDASDDLADGLTDDTSGYTIAAINAAAKSHVLAVSTLKRRKNRQAFLSLSDTFATVKETSANIASFRCSLTFEDFKQIDSSGSIKTFLPWMGSTLAAAMQAAGFYKNIEWKGINTSGVLVRGGDFNPKSDGQVEDALQSGLLVARPARTGGYIFVSDQTTYGKDANFVFNSIQSVYAADIISTTMAQRMESAFVGQSVADVSAPVARAYAEGILAEFLRLKLIAPSDDGAPKGWKNLSIRIVGNAMLVSVEVKLAGAIDFILIDFLFSPVEQTA